MWSWRRRQIWGWPMLGVEVAISTTSSLLSHYWCSGLRRGRWSLAVSCRIYHSIATLREVKIRMAFRYFGLQHFWKFWFMHVSQPRSKANGVFRTANGEHAANFILVWPSLWVAFARQGEQIFTIDTSIQNFKQSIIMVFAMSLMQELCVRVTKPQTATSHFFLDFDFRYFWQWSRFLDYVQGRGFEGSKYFF